MELFKDNSKKLTNHEDIKKAIRIHFEELYRIEEEVTQEEMETMSNDIPFLIDKDNDLLKLPISEEEVRKVVWSLHSNKNPGPDGFMISFYRICWHIINKDMLKKINWNQSKNNIGGAANSTFLDLITKENNMISIKIYMPIFLCNPSYKILSKVISNRPKKVIPLIIFENEGGFIAGRQIYDKIMMV